MATTGSSWQDTLLLPRWLIRFTLGFLLLCFLSLVGKATWNYLSSRPETLHFEVTAGRQTGDEAQAIATALSIWQSTVENIGNDIATIELSLAVAGIVIAFLVALGGYFLRQSIDSKTAALQAALDDLKKELEDLDDRFKEIKSDAQTVDTLVTGLNKEIEEILKEIQMTELTKRNPYYNRPSLDFLALLARWKHSVSAPESPLTDDERFLLGCYQYSHDRWRQAIEEFQKISAEARGKNTYNVSFYLGLAYDDAQDYSSAIHHYTLEIEQPDPNRYFDALAYSNRGFTYVELEKYQDALADFEAAIVADREDRYQDPYPHYGRAIALFRIDWAGRKSEILKALEHGERLEFANDHFRESYSRDQFRKMRETLAEVKSRYEIS